MEGAKQAIAVFLLMCVSRAASDAICGDDYCDGSGAYCCRLDSGETGCCWDTFVYQLWWFWVIWVVIFFLILGCVLACWRRRRAQYRYVVMANSEYPTYGTVVHSSSTAYPAPAGSYTSPPAGYNGATAPPPYPSQGTKPPPYNG